MPLARILRARRRRRAEREFARQAQDAVRARLAGLFEEFNTRHGSFIVFYTRFARDIVNVQTNIDAVRAQQQAYGIALATAALIEKNLKQLCPVKTGAARESIYSDLQLAAPESSISITLPLPFGLGVLTAGMTVPYAPYIRVNGRLWSDTFERVVYREYTTMVADINKLTRFFLATPIFDPLTGR